jgi:hypothetical protein
LSASVASMVQGLPHYEQKGQGEIRDAQCLLPLSAISSQLGRSHTRINNAC